MITIHNNDDILVCNPVHVHTQQYLQISNSGLIKLNILVHILKEYTLIIKIKKKEILLIFLFSSLCICLVMR